MSASSTEPSGSILEPIEYILEPLNERIVVRPVEIEEITKGGLIIPSAAQEKPQRGTVLFVGPGVLDDAGIFRPTVLKPGDNIIYGKYAGTEITLPDDSKVLVMRESDVLGRIVKKP